MTIDVYIDRLVLDGFDRRDGRRISAAIEQRLGDLVDAGGRPEMSDATSIDRVDAGTVKTSRGGAPRQIGAHIAEAVYRGSGG